MLPRFNKEVCKEAVVIEGDEVVSLRPEEQGTPQLLVKTSKIPKANMETMEEDWVSVVPGTPSATQRRGVDRDVRQVARSH